MKRIFSLFIVYLMLITPIVAAQETGIRTEPIQFTQNFQDTTPTEPITFTEIEDVLTQTGELNTQIDNLARQLAQEEQPNIATTQLQPPAGITTDADNEVTAFDLGIDELFGVVLGESGSQTAINVQRDKETINKQIQQLMPDVVRGPTGNPYCAMSGIGMPETTSITGAFIEITGAQTVKITKKQKKGELQASLRAAYSMGQTYYDHTRALAIYTGGSNFGSTKYGGLYGAFEEQIQREAAWFQDKAQQNAWGGHMQNFANFGEGTIAGLTWFAEKAAFAATNIRAYHYKYTDTVQLMGQAIGASENPGGAGMYGLLGRGAQYGGKGGLATYYNTIASYQNQIDGSQSEIDNANNNQRMNSNQKDTWAAQANAQSSAIASEISVINTQISYLQGIGGFAAQYQLDLLQDQKNSLEQQQATLGEQLNAYNSGNWDKYWQGKADNAQKIIDGTQKNYDAFKKDPVGQMEKSENAEAERRREQYKKEFDDAVRSGESQDKIDQIKSKIDNVNNEVASEFRAQKPLSQIDKENHERLTKEAQDFENKAKEAEQKGDLTEAERLRGLAKERENSADKLIQHSRVTYGELKEQYYEELRQIGNVAAAKGMSFEDASIYVGFSDMIGGFNALGVPTGLTGEISQFVDDIILGAIPEVEDAIKTAEEMQKMIAELSDPNKQQEFKEELDKILAGLNDVKGRLGGLADDALGLLNKMPQLKQMLDKMAEDGKFSKSELQEFLAQFGIAAGSLAEMMAKFIQLMKEFMSWIVRMKNLMNEIWYEDFPQTTPIGIPEGAQWCTALCPIDKYSSAGQCLPPHQFDPPAAPAAPIVPGLTLTSAEAEAASGGPGRPPNLPDRRAGGQSGGAIGESEYGKDQNVYYEDMIYYDEYGNEMDVEFNGRVLEDGSWEITITINGKEHKIEVPKDQQDKYKNIDDYIKDLKNDPTKWLYETGPDGKIRYKPGFEDSGIKTIRPPGYYEHDEDGNITGDGVHITIDEDGDCRSYAPTGEGSQEDCKAKAKKAAEDAVANAETTGELLDLLNQAYDKDQEIAGLESEKAAVPVQPYSYLDATPEQQEKMKGLDIASIEAGNELSQAQTEQATAEKTFDEARAKYTGAALRDWLNSAEAESLRAPLAEANRKLSDAEAKMNDASQARDDYAKDTNAEARADIQAKIDQANADKALIDQAIKGLKETIYDEAYQKALDDCAKGKLNKDDCDKYKRGLLDDRIDSLEDTLSDAEKDANAKADEALRQARENAAKTGKSMTPEEEQKIRDKAFNDAMEQNGGNAAKKELDDLKNIREAQDFQQKTQRCDEVIAELTEKYTEPYKEQLSDLNAQLGSPGISAEEKDSVQAQINKINGQINAKLRADHSYEFCQGVKERAAAAILGADAQNFAQKMADARLKIEELNVKLQDALKELTEKIKRFEERMDILNARIQQLQERLNEANKYPGASNYQTAKTNLENEIQKAQNEINEIEQDLATERNKINQIYEELEKTRNEITTAITEQMTALGTDPSKWTFEQQMTAIMLSATQTQLNDLILKIQDDMSYLAYQLIREIALPDLDYEGHKYYSQEALQRIQQYIGQYVTQLDGMPPTIFEQMFIGELQRLHDRATTRNAEIESIRYVAQEYTPETLAQLKEYAFLSKLITGLQKEINIKLESLQIYDFEGREEEAISARNSLRELQELQQKYAEQRNSLSIDDNENIDPDLRAIIDAFRYSVTTQDFNNALNRIQQKTKTLNYELTIIQQEIDNTQKEIDNAQQQIQQTIAPEQRVNLRTKIDILTRKLNDLLNKQQQTKTINDLIKTYYYGNNGIMAKYQNSQIDAQQKALLQQQKADRESRDSILNYLSPRDMVIEPLGLMTDREDLAEDKTYFIQQVPLTGLKILSQLTQKGVELDQITKDNIDKLIEKHGIYVSDEDRKALEDYVEYYLDYDIKTQTGTLTIEDQKNHLSRLANELASREHYELASQYATEIATISEDKQGWERLAGAWNSKAEGQTMITWAMELSDITLPGLGLVTFLPSLAVKITGTATRGVARIANALDFARASNFLVKTVDVTGIALKTIANAPIAALKTIFGAANKTAKGLITITGKATDRIIQGTKTAEVAKYVEQVQTAINKGLPIKPKDLDLLKANKGINDAKRFVNPARAAQRNAQNIAQAMPQQAARAQAIAADAGRWGIRSNIGRTIKGIGRTPALQKVTTQIDELVEKYYRHATLYPDDIAGLGKIGDELSTISRNYDKIAEMQKAAAIARQTRIAQIRRASNNLWENSYIVMKKATGDRLTLTPTEYLQATRTGRLNSLANFNKVISNYGKGTATLDEVMDAVKTAEGAGKLNHAATTSELAGKTTMNMIEQSEVKLLDVRNKLDEIYTTLDEAGLPSGRVKAYNADQDLLLFGGEIRIRHETAHFKLADEINEFTGFAVYDGLGNPTKLITQDGVFKIESMTPIAGQRVYNTIQELTGTTHFNELTNLRNAARQGELGGLTPQIALQLDILKGTKIGDETLDATQLATRMDDLGRQATELQSRLGRVETITPPAIARIDETPIQTTPRIETPTPPSATRTLDNLYDDIATRGRTIPDGIDLGDGIIARQLKGTFEYFDETGTIRQLDEHIMLFKNQEPYAMIRADGTIVTIEKLDDIGVQGLLTQQMRQGLLTTPRIIETLPQLRVGQQIADISKLEPTAIDEVLEIAKMTDDSAELAAQEARINSQIELLEQEFIKASEEFKKTTGQDFTVRTTFEDIPSLRRITGCAINCPIEMQYVIGRAPDEIVMVRRPSSIEFYEKTTTGQHQLVKIVKEGERNFDQLSNIMSITTTRTIQAIPDKIAFDLGFYKASETGVEQLKVLEEYRAQTRALEEYAARVAKKQLQLYRKGKLQGYNAVAIRVQEMEYPRVLVDSRTPDTVILENGYEINRITTEMDYIDEYDFAGKLSVDKRPFVQITSPTGRKIINQDGKVFQVIGEQNGIPKLKEIGDFNAPEELFPDLDRLFTGEVDALPGQIARSTGIVELSEDVLRNIEQLKQQKAQLRAEAGLSQLDVNPGFYLKSLQEQPTTAKTYADYLANPKKHYSEKGVQDSLKWYEQQGLNPETLVLETENTIRGIKNGEIRGWKYTDTATQAEGELGGDLLRVKEIDLGDGTLRTLTFIGDAEGKLLHGSLLKSIVNNKIDNVVDDLVERAKLGDTNARALLDDPAEIMRHIVSEASAGLPTGRQHTLTMSMLDEFGNTKFVPGGEPIYGIRLFDDGGKITAKIDILGVESAAMYGQRGIGNPIRAYDADFDIIIQPTDGLWEQFDKYGTMFGEERLMQTIKRSIESGATPEKLRDDLLAEIADFVGVAKRNDDLTFRLMAKTDITPRPISEFAQEASKEIKSIPAKTVNDYVAARKIQPKRIDELVTAQTDELIPVLDETDELIPVLDEADELVPVLDEAEELPVFEELVQTASEAATTARRYIENIPTRIRQRLGLVEPETAIKADLDDAVEIQLKQDYGDDLISREVEDVLCLTPIGPTGAIVIDCAKGAKAYKLGTLRPLQIIDDIGAIRVYEEEKLLTTISETNPAYREVQAFLRTVDETTATKLDGKMAIDLGLVDSTTEAGKRVIQLNEELKIAESITTPTLRERISNIPGFGWLKPQQQVIDPLETINKIEAVPFRLQKGDLPDVQTLDEVINEDLTSVLFRGTVDQNEVILKTFKQPEKLAELSNMEKIAGDDIEIWRVFLISAEREIENAKLLSKLDMGPKVIGEVNAGGPKTYAYERIIGTSSERLGDLPAAHNWDKTITDLADKTEQLIKEGYLIDTTKFIVRQDGSIAFTELGSMKLISEAPLDLVNMRGKIPILFYQLDFMRAKAGLPILGLGSKADEAMQAAKLKTLVETIQEPIIALKTTNGATLEGILDDISALKQREIGGIIKAEPQYVSPEFVKEHMNNVYSYGESGKSIELAIDEIRKANRMSLMTPQQLANRENLLIDAIGDSEAGPGIESYFEWIRAGHTSNDVDVFIGTDGYLLELLYKSKYGEVPTQFFYMSRSSMATVDEVASLKNYYMSRYASSEADAIEAWGQTILLNDRLKTHVIVPSALEMRKIEDAARLTGKTIDAAETFDTYYSLARTKFFDLFETLPTQTREAALREWRRFADANSQALIDGKTINLVDPYGTYHSQLHLLRMMQDYLETNKGTLTELLSPEELRFIEGLDPRILDSTSLIRFKMGFAGEHKGPFSMFTSSEEAFDMITDYNYVRGSNVFEVSKLAVLDPDGLVKFILSDGKIGEDMFKFDQMHALQLQENLLMLGSLKERGFLWSNLQEINMPVKQTVNQLTQTDLIIDTNKEIAITA